ncbi:MAG TPA: ABC transporter ATP-binding protein [Puia sp.]|uniref:ABC transporter ATP-binding protein n=1 Tax=Puia sp. TaxID=2045100 RepID=UPI002B58F9D3|nr:ABC transporter ATP-binding protein [Puia sp.]HVU97090.1 ABC transporter ATP-binding protein [Puia sp.]
MSPVIQTKLTPGGLPGRRGVLSVERPREGGKVMRRLWGYLHFPLLTLVFLLVIVNTGANLACSYLLRPIINHYIIPHDLPGLGKMVLLLLAIYLAGSVAAILQARLMVVVAQKAVNGLRRDLYSRLQSLPIRFFDRQSHGDLMSRFTNDMDNISDSLDNSITQLFSSSITLLGTLVLMLLISPLLTLVTLVIVPCMLWLAARIIRKSKKIFLDQQNALGTANGYIEEMISGLKVVKVFCHEHEVIGSFETLNEELRKKSARAQLYSGIMMPVMQNLNTINFALTATVGGLLSVTRGLDIGGLAAFLQYSRQFARPVNEISNQFNSLQAALAGAERIFQIIDEQPEPADKAEAIQPGEIRGEVVFEHVNFGYVDGQPILKDITFRADPGQKIALVGSTGAGKTTIMNLLPRFYDIQSGNIRIDGMDIRDLRREDLRHLMAIVLQDTHLFTGTVMENIRYGRLDATDEEVIAAATLANAHSFIRRLPRGYKTVLERDGNNLSQGQRQLLNIARATVAAPALLILDEATSSIDTRTEIAIQAGMDQLMKGRTSFVIAHRLSTVRNADEILVLEKGEIIERGTHSALIQQKGRYYELYQGQFD